MFFKVFGLISLVLFIISVGFSFYFSQEIVSLNRRYQEFEIQQSNQNQQFQILQTEFLNLSQNKSIDSSNYFPINESIQN